MDIEAFEDIAATAYRHDVLLEFLDGTIRERPWPTGDTAQVLSDVQRHVMTGWSEYRVHLRRGLEVGPDSGSRLHPDAVVTTRGALTGQGSYSPPGTALAVLELSAYGPDADRGRAYAAAGVPVYAATYHSRAGGGLVVCHQPEGQGYREVDRYDHQDRITLPGLPITLDTSLLSATLRFHGSDGVGRK